LTRLIMAFSWIFIGHRAHAFVVCCHGGLPTTASTRPAGMAPRLAGGGTVLCVFSLALGACPFRWSSSRMASLQRAKLDCTNGLHGLHLPERELARAVP
jgi:hypothetical protein